MRPTEIGVPIPRARTPGPYTVLFTHQGDRLGPARRSFLRVPSFTRSPRFTQYRDWFRRTGAVGPGEYSVDYCKAKHGRNVKISPARCKRAGLYASGNLLVVDPVLEALLERRKSHRASGTFQRRLEPLRTGGTTPTLSAWQQSPAASPPRSRPKKKHLRDRGRSVPPLDIPAYKG